MNFARSINAIRAFYYKDTISSLLALLLYPYWCSILINQTSSILDICNGAISDPISSCSQTVSGWTFDSLSGRCVEVNFTTCGRIVNNMFESMETCSRTCIDQSFIRKSV